MHSIKYDKVQTINSWWVSTLKCLAPNCHPHGVY